MKSTLYSNLVLDSLKEGLSGKEGFVMYDYKNRKITATQISESIEKIAVDLVGRGIQKGDRVIFLIRPSIEAVIYFFALLRAGAVVVLVDPEMGQENFISRVDFSKVRFMLQDPILEKIEKYSFIKPILTFFNIWFPSGLPIENKNRITVKNFEQVLEQKITTSYNEEVCDENADMVIIFTSGTVDYPKGVVHSYRSLHNALNIISSEISISSMDFLFASQFYFLIIGLSVSSRTYIPSHKPFNAKRFYDVALKFGITSAFLLPHEGERIYTYCTDHGLKVPPSFKTILFGSAPVTKGFLSRFATACDPALKVFGVYGSTEMLPISMIEMHNKIKYGRPGDVLGKPAKGVHIEIAEDNEILASGPQLFIRYLGDNNATCFRSGDLGEIDSDGNIVLLGRKKDMIIRNRYNVYPTLFEGSISAVPGVIECSMVGVYDTAIEDERIVLFVVPDPKVAHLENDLRTLLKTGKHSIDSYAYPDEIILVDTLPRSGRSKKVDKKALRELAYQKLCLQ